MSKWPGWLKALLIVLVLGAALGVSQLMLYFDKLGVSKFDL